MQNHRPFDFPPSPPAAGDHRRRSAAATAAPAAVRTTPPLRIPSTGAGAGSSFTARSGGPSALGFPIGEAPMSRNSRHKYHNLPKSGVSREWSGSEVEERAVREAPPAKSVARVSKGCPDSGGKRKARDVVAPGNGDCGVEEGGLKRRKQEGGGDRKEGVLVKDVGKVGIDRKSGKDLVVESARDHKCEMGEKIRVGRIEPSRREDAKTSGKTHDSKRGVENDDWQTGEGAYAQKELEEKIHKKAVLGSRDSGNYVSIADGGRRASREDHLEHGQLKDEENEVNCCKDKRSEEYEDRGSNYDKHRGLKYVGDYSNERAGNRDLRNERKVVDSNHEKAKLQTFGCESPVENRNTKYLDQEVRKRSLDDSKNYGDRKSCSPKEQCGAIYRKTSSGNKSDSVSDKRTSESRNQLLDSQDFSPRRSRQKESFSSNVNDGRETRGVKTKNDEPHYAEFAEEKRQRRRISRDASDCVFETSFLEKSKRQDDRSLCRLSTEVVSSLQYNKSPKPIGRSSPVVLVDKSPSSSGDRKCANRAGFRKILDAEEVVQSGAFKGVKDYTSNKCRPPNISLEKESGDRLQVHLHREPTPINLPFYKTGGGGSQSPLPSFPNGDESSSKVTPSEEDFRSQMGEFKMSNHYRRIGDSGNMVGRVQGSNPWKGFPSWPPPMANGFFPLHHGPRPIGFHRVVPPFSASHFGVQPHIDMNHAGVAWHDIGHPFGCQNSDEVCLPLLHGWDGSNGVFGDDAHNYKIPDWEQNRILVSKSGWELKSVTGRGQNGSMTDPLTPKREIDYNCNPDVHKDYSAGGSDRQDDALEMSYLEHSSTESIDVKPTIALLTENKPSVAFLLNDFVEKKPEISNQMSADDSVKKLDYYLAKVDISVDLVRPELYKQCMSIRKMKEPNGIRDAKEVELKDDSALSKHPYYNLQKLLFPTSAEAILEKLMLLYERQKEVNVKLHTSSPPNSECEKILMTKNVEVVVAGDFPDAVEQDEKTGSDCDNILDPESVRQNLSQILECVSEGNADAQEDPSAVKEIVSSEIDSTEASAARMPDSNECRVILSRIHLSPANTH